MMSHPSRPWIVSLPPSPTITSRWSVPRRRSRLALPTIVALRPAQYRSRACAPDGRRATIRPAAIAMLLSLTVGHLLAAHAGVVALATVDRVGAAPGLETIVVGIAQELVVAVARPHVLDPGQCVGRRDPSV